MPELRSLHFLFLEFAQASLAHPQIKNAPVGGMGLGCGERGIRTPGPVTVNGFQDRRNRPLCHRMYTQKGFERLSIRFWMECGKEYDPKKGWNRVLPMGWIPARLGPHHFN
ncbi:MAG: hypothetical protein EBR22_04170 [Cytophagia bacterium]|nr:hypothetical protein [Cytophagia bacterium]